MGLETGTYISDLNSSNPALGDSVSQGDDHIRLLKSAIKATFPNIAGAVTPTHTELNYVDGVTSNIQTQLNALVAADLTKLPLAGGTLTGDLILAGNPDAALKAAPKQYVDAADALALPKAGGTMTGDLVLAGAPTVDLNPATKKYVDDVGADLEASFGQGRILALAAFNGLTNSSYVGSWTFTTSSGVVTVNTTSPHPYLVGSKIQIYSASDASLNETVQTITEIGANSFKFNAAAAASGSLYVRVGLIKGFNIDNIKIANLAGVYNNQLCFTFTNPNADTNYIPMNLGYYSMINPGYVSSLYGGHASSQYKAYTAGDAWQNVQKIQTGKFYVDLTNSLGFHDIAFIAALKW